MLKKKPRHSEDKIQHVGNDITILCHGNSVLIMLKGLPVETGSPFITDVQDVLLVYKYDGLWLCCVSRKCYLQVLLDY